MAERCRLVDAAAVPADSTVVFVVRDRETGEEREAILIAHDDGIAGWLNSCRHFTHIRLDAGSGALVRDGEIVCTNHGAMFEAESGRCTFGPCEGAVLEPVDVAVEDGAVHLIDEDYAFVHLGPMATDDLDLGSTSNVEF